jgi:hypothetical protein
MNEKKDIFVIFRLGIFFLFLFSFIFLSFFFFFLLFIYSDLFRMICLEVIGLKGRTPL